VLDQIRKLNPRVMPALEWQRAVWNRDWSTAERFSPFERPAQNVAMLATYRALASGDAKQKQSAARQVSALPADCCVNLRIQMLTQLGRDGEALALLDKFGLLNAPGARPGAVGPFLWDPALRPLWDDPGIEPFLQRHGWIAYWRASKSRPDICGATKPPEFCRLLR
jgi:hypothetical protein